MPSPPSSRAMKGARSIRTAKSLPGPGLRSGPLIPATASFIPLSGWRLRRPRPSLGLLSGLLIIPAMLPSEEPIGARIARLRRSKQWTQRQLAAKLGIRNTSLSKYERGVYELRVDMLGAVAEALGTSVDFLLTGREGSSARDMRFQARVTLLEELPQELRDHVVFLLDSILQAHRSLSPKPS